MAEHAWCRDIPRDEAVRAAEDGRSGPLPTLEKVIAAVTERRPVQPGGGGNVTGLRTERVTLEITHDLDAPPGEWIVQVIDESLGLMESVRVVEEAKLAPPANADAGSNQAPAASGAAGTEVVAWGVRHSGHSTFGPYAVWSVRESEELAREAFDAAKGWVHFPLYAAPQPAKGWLTAEEQKTLSETADVLDDRKAHAYARFVRELLARSTPPEVMHPAHRGAPEIRERDSWWRKALAAAGVTVKEVGRE